MTTWVLLRGLAREARHWGGLPALLQAQLPPGTRVVAPDLPGNGRRWRETCPSSVDGLLQGVRSELAAQGCQPPYLLLAVSLGGMLAVRWALRDPASLRGGVLVNSSLGGLAPFWQRLRPGSYPTVLRLLAARDPLVRERGVLQLTSNRALDPATAQAWAAFARECPIRRGNVLRQLLAAARFRAPARPPAVPLLLLASERDRLVAPACSRAVAHAWQVPLRLHPAAGHDLPLDDPQWVVGQALQWAAGLRTATSGAAA